MVLFGLVFMTMTTLPAFLPSLEFIASLVGGIIKIAGIALLVFGIVNNIAGWKGVMPIPFMVVAGFAAVSSIVSMIPIIGYVFTWIAFIVSIVAIFLAAGAFNVQWKNPATAGAVVLAMGTTAAFYEVVDSILFVNLAAIAAYVLVMMNAPKMNSVLSADAQSKLKIAVICGIVASVMKMIPVVSTLLAWLPYTVFVVFLIIAFMGWKNSFPAANLVFVAAIVLLVEECLDFIPVVCYFVCPFIALAAIVLSVFGWYNVINKLEK